MRIVTMKPKGREGELFTVELDDGRRGEFAVEGVARRGWRTEGEVSEEAWAAAIREDEPARCRLQAWRLLNHRHRSEAELRQGLARRGYGAEVIDHLLADLRAKGLLNDGVFARTLVRERIRKADGPRAIRQVLRRKGIGEELTGEALASENPEGEWEEGARKLLEKWNRRSRPEEPAKRRLAAAQHLLRKGYDSDIVWRLVSEMIGREE